MNVEEIQAVRVAEAARTINMSTKELVEYSQNKGGELLKRLLESKKRKEKISNR